MADGKKKFAAKQRNFYIESRLRCINFNTPVNDWKSKQDKNLQKTLVTRPRAKNKQGARKYPLRENTLHHPTPLSFRLVAHIIAHAAGAMLK